ncbi:unnamed protein product [Commensalibacter communis]|nr:unnamed protein product [Commensalibacter communis]
MPELKRLKIILVNFLIKNNKIKFNIHTEINQMTETFLLGATTLYEEYTMHYTAHREYFKELRENVTALITKKRLFSCMNTTKWLELQTAIHTLPFPPANIVRCVTDAENHPESVNAMTILEEKIPSWFGCWSNYYCEGLPPLFNIEWMKVRPQLEKFRGALIKPEIIDETNEFRAILERLNIPYEETGNIFTIYGYKAP